MFFEVNLHAMYPQRDIDYSYGTNMYFFLADMFQISSQGYNDCTFEVSAPVTSLWSPKGTNLEHYI